MRNQTYLLKDLDFGNEAGDDVEARELLEYFVEHDAFAPFIDPRRRFLVATARKGVGKSALLKWTAHRVAATDPDAIIISVRGSDLVRSRFRLTSTLSDANEYARDWMVRLCTVVNREIARRINVAVTDDQVSLIETAELEGYRQRNLFGCLMDRFQTVVLGDKRSMSKLPIANEIETLRRVRERNVWIIVDDLDATFQNTPAERLALATFFSACRYMIQDLGGVNIRASVRTDVWAILRRYDEALDKMSQYVSEIHWLQRDFLALLALRIKASLIHSPASGLGAKSPPNAFVEEVFVPQMQWGENRGASGTGGLPTPRLVDSYKIIYTLSYERPRWAIQLCKLAQESAVRRSLPRITKENIDEVWAEYGIKRIEDLVAEHKHQCPQVHELINAFRGVERLLTRHDLFAWINSRVSNHLEVAIEGERTRSPQEVARFLYRIGFILARSDGEDGEYEHYRFDQMSDFLSARTDDDFGMKWEIHPCYRQALDIKKLDQSHRERFTRQRGGR